MWNYSNTMFNTRRIIVKLRQTEETNQGQKTEVSVNNAFQTLSLTPRG